MWEWINHSDRRANCGRGVDGEKIGKVIVLSAQTSLVLKPQAYTDHLRCSVVHKSTGLLVGYTYVVCMMHFR